MMNGHMISAQKMLQTAAQSNSQKIEFAQKKIQKKARKKGDAFVRCLTNRNTCGEKGFQRKAFSPYVFY
jgi:hypothetical protein